MTTVIYNGQELRETDCNPLHAHGGHMLFDSGCYYWYGENRTVPCTSLCWTKRKWLVEVHVGE